VIGSHARYRAALAAAVLMCLGIRAIAQPPIARNALALRDLGGISEPQSLFDRESDKLRIVLLFSPT
jgi:hypothetical protein